MLTITRPPQPWPYIQFETRKLVNYLGVQPSSVPAFFCTSDLYFSHLQGFSLVQLSKKTEGSWSASPGQAWLS